MVDLKSIPTDELVKELIDREDYMLALTKMQRQSDADAFRRLADKCADRELKNAAASLAEMLSQKVASRDSETPLQGVPESN